MNSLTYTETRKRLKEVMDRVVQDRKEVVVTRQKAESVVIVSQADWNSMHETLHLLSSLRNVDRLVYRVKGSGADRRLEIAQCRFDY